MSDEREAHLQALLKKIRKDLFVTVMFCSVGWFVMMHAAAMDGFGRVVLTLLGPIIAIFPILRSGGRGLFFWQHYEVVEIDRNTGQQVSTDGGFGYWSSRQAAQLLKAHEQYSTVGTSESDEFKARVNQKGTVKHKEEISSI